jgi:hypothetical protein
MGNSTLAYFVILNVWGTCGISDCAVHQCELSSHVNDSLALAEKEDHWTPQHVP